ncbi:MAG: Ig-like domain-containing protein [Gemmatimonadota bacterium]|nr:MAG: Ig-like domain-containing protein [Gemmatimonadota bacterium]
MASVSTRRLGKRKIGGWLISMALAAAAVLASCSDEPTGPGHGDDATDLFPGLTVSEPTGAAGFSAAASGGGARAAAAPDFAYISARPGTFSDAQTFTITNLASGESQTVSVVEGGFDPVELEAVPGDELEIVIEHTDRSTSTYFARVPSRRRPRVVRSMPPNGATEVLLSIAVMVVYSEPIDINTVTAEDVQLRVDGEPVAGTLELSEDGLRSWFTPAEPLQAATAYSLVITTGVLDRQGDPLDEEVQATFTTGSGILNVSAGHFHTCAVDAHGAAICWGWNDYGQCGRPFSGLEPPGYVPTQLRFTSVSSGNAHTCGVTVDGEAYCWGWNYFGQLGNGTVTDSDSPVRVVGGHSFVSLTAGQAHTCGLTTDGAAYCWGRHDFLQLGPGRSELCIHGESDRPCSKTPMRVARRFESLTAGHLFTCGLLADGGALCWGGDHVGQLGTDSPWQIETCGWYNYRCSRYPRPVSGGHTFVHLSAGQAHACGVRIDGTAYCWGRNDDGQLGAGFTSEPRERQATPLAVVGGHSFVSIASSQWHTCALAGDGQAYCWGSNLYGQLGIGDPGGDVVPEPVAVTGSYDFVALTTSGVAHTCAVTSEGDVYCWGVNYDGQLGHDPSSVERSSTSPLLVPLP